MTCHKCQATLYRREHAGETMAHPGLACWRCGTWIDDPVTGDWSAESARYREEFRKSGKRIWDID